MADLRPAASRYRSLLASQRALARAAPLVRFGLLAVGAAVFLDQVRPMVSDAQFTWGERRVMGIVALVTLGSFGLAAWAAGRLLRAASELIEVFVDGADAAVRANHLMEAHLVPALNRAVAALERLAEGAGAAANNPGDGPARAAAAVRQAVRDGRWGRAERLLDDWRSDRPHDADADALAAELDRARRAEADDLRARLDAARAADDPERVIACRDALTQHLRGEPLHALDRRVVRWLADWVRRRAPVGAGTIPSDVPAVAARAADSFADTPEGAALLAALPELRRRAGLCLRCGRPFRGPADACPDCLDLDPTNSDDPGFSARPGGKGRGQSGTAPKGRPRP
jgi:hypothetical protein